MKKLFFFFLAVALGFSACTEDDLGPTLSVNSAPQLSAPGGTSSYVLLEDQATQLFPAITWTEADFGFDAGVTYSVELDRAGNNFADPVVIGTTRTNSLSDLTVGQLNTFLFASKALPGEEASNVEVRIAANVSPEVPTVYSNVVTLTVTPYTIVIVYPKLQVPGSYQGWNPADNTTVIYSANSNNRYEGYLYFASPNTEFKYTLGESWDTNYGDDGANGSLEPNGANLLAADAGLYRLNVDLNQLTHTYALTSWGIIGSATPTGWDSDTDMTYDAAERKLTVTLDLVAGEIKFRANDDWAVNLGDNDTNRSLEYGGANIPVAEAGNYTIDLLLVDKAVYTYKLTKN